MGDGDNRFLEIAILPRVHETFGSSSLTPKLL